MYKFMIDYFDKSATRLRSATVFAEDLEAAVEKIERADPDFDKVDGFSFVEKPNWRRAEE